MTSGDDATKVALTKQSPDDIRQCQSNVAILRERERHFHASRGRVGARTLEREDKRRWGFDGCLDQHLPRSQQSVLIPYAGQNVVVDNSGPAQPIERRV